MKVIILIGSKADLDWGTQIKTILDRFEIPSVIRISSAHKVPIKCYALIKEYEKENVVFITIAGMSNALSEFSDAQTYCPVIACPPPYSNKYSSDGSYSTVRMSSGISPLTILSPEKAALTAAKIFALSNTSLREKIIQFQEKKREELEEADTLLQKSQE
jgi:5-(carboxyamino)imidazole ribonucleotide mutase